MRLTPKKNEREREREISGAEREEQEGEAIYYEKNSIRWMVKQGKERRRMRRERELQSER